MKRRDFIKLSAGLGATMAATTPLSSAFAQTKMVLKASDVHPLGYPTVEAVVRMGKKLEAATNGRLTIQMFPSMQLGGEKEMIEQAQIGALQIGTSYASSAAMCEELPTCLARRAAGCAPARRCARHPAGRRASCGYYRM